MFMIEEWGADASGAQILVDAGLWRETAKGYQFHDWKAYQQSRADVEAKREREREKKARWRRNNAGQFEGNADHVGETSVPVPEGVPGGHVGESPGESHRPFPTLPSPSLPSPVNKTSSSDAEASDVESFSDEVKRLCELLAELVRGNGHKVGVVGKTWWASCERLMRLDGYSAAQIEWLIRWATANEFWQANVRSMDTLRKQFSRMKLQALAERDKQAGKQSAFARNLPVVAQYQEAEIEEVRDRNAIGVGERSGQPDGDAGDGGGLAPVHRLAGL
ncbi:hypothetical protein [Glaciibacter superstes]|uniref:hypothetical protein n=1 Tax=Glaciibacter superstes TaxID=501023 RepID=UPI0012F8485E|nr:hypothetical protein [Glaciibacter superstes]